MLLCRNRFMAGRIGAEAFHAELRRLYALRDPHSYDMNGIYGNLQLPLEIICQLDPERISDDEARWLGQFYRQMTRYAFHMPNSGSLSSMLEYCVDIIERFIEVPEGPTFEGFALQCMAALHPPTYVHSVMVAKLSVCLCTHLIDRDPRWLVGAPGCASIDDVRSHRQALLDYTFHAALCHDIGKLSIIDTIFVYGRNLFDMEFELIRTHPHRLADAGALRLHPGLPGGGAGAPPLVRRLPGLPRGL